LVCTQCKIELYVAEVGLRDCVCRIDHDGHFKSASGLIELIALDVQRGEVVPWLRQLGKTGVI
jgi:hypothetical protein